MAQDWIDANILVDLDQQVFSVRAVTVELVFDVQFYRICKLLEILGQLFQPIFIHLWQMPTQVYKSTFHRARWKCTNADIERQQKNVWSKLLHMTHTKKSAAPFQRPFHRLSTDFFVSGQMALLTFVSLFPSFSSFFCSHMTYACVFYFISACLSLLSFSLCSLFYLCACVHACLDGLCLFLLSLFLSMLVRPFSCLIFYLPVLIKLRMYTSRVTRLRIFAHWAIVYLGQIF
jgi:hypothetical protein